jgi:hypothetical protein
VRPLVAVPDHLAYRALLPLTDEPVEAARLGLLARYELSVEASAPTAAFDDVLSAWLSCERLAEAVVDRSAGDVLVAFTDGVTEARSPDGSEFGEERPDVVFAEDRAVGVIRRAGWRRI